MEEQHQLHKTDKINMKRYMILDKENIVINVISFPDHHNEDLQKFIDTAPQAERIIEITNEEDLFGIGLKYNEEINKCMPSKPYPSWIWDEIEWTWICPVPVPENPNNHRYIWDEENMQWALIQN